MIGTGAAGDDGPDFGCRLLAPMAQDGLAVFSLLEEVGQFIVAVSLPIFLISIVLY